jgi:prolyl-tRNA synthetase
MFWSKLFIPTLREDPADIESVARRLLIRAGYLRKSTYLYLGQRSISKITAIVREEMNASGGQELIAQQAGAITPIAAELRSYKQLPQIWYRIRDRTLESWSFELSQDCSSRHADAFRRAFDRCGLNYVAGKTRFLTTSDRGGDTPDLDRPDEPTPPAIPDPDGDLRREEFHTPGQKTIADLSAFTGLPETSQMKSVVMVADGKPVLAILRGDHTLSETKLRAYLAVTDLRPARPEEIRDSFGADAGSLGPVGVKNITVIADTALEGRRNMICGANKNDYHFRNVTPGEDFEAEFWDIREIFERGAVIARLSWRFTRPSPINVTNQAGAQQPVGRGAYQLCIDSVLDALIEQNLDKDGIVLPPAVAPFSAIVTPINFNERLQQDAARKLYDALCDKTVDALLDDRDERPGVKFKDADLIGVPYRVTIGKKLAQGLVEVVDRRTHESSDVKVEEAAAFIAAKSK